MVSIVGASGRAPIIGRVQLAPTYKARKSDRNDEVAAQRRRWTFCETISVVAMALKFAGFWPTFS